MATKQRHGNRQKSTKSFLQLCAELEKKYGRPEEVLFKLLKHSCPDIRMRAASTIMNKKVPTPRQIDLSGLMGGSIRGQILIDIAGEQTTVGQPVMGEINPAENEKSTIKRIPVNTSTGLTAPQAQIPKVSKSALSAVLPKVNT